MKYFGYAFAATFAVMCSSTVDASTRVIGGERNGLSWQASNTIVGMTPTADGPMTGGGDPIFFPSSNKSGVVSLIMDYGTEGRYICSGSLVSGRSIVTAAHCISPRGNVATPLTTTAYFFTGDPNERTPFSPNAVAIDVSHYFTHADYTGEVIDQNDIAVLRLMSTAPKEFERYGLYTQGDLTGTGFNVAGYGGRSTVGGLAGNDARTGFLREGDNIYDYAWGDDAFGGFFTDIIGGENFFGIAEIEYSYVSDFDSGRAGNDTSCQIAAAVGAGGYGCNTGVGAREVGVAGGDSGGPGFVDGKLASVNSYGLSFGPSYGDCTSALDSSCGEFSGYVPIFIHEKFILDSMGAAIPEPASWALMIAGFGLVGGLARRRRYMNESIQAL